MNPLNLGSLAGVPIIVSKFLPDTERRQVRFPKTKRKRIRKKWAKRGQNWSIMKKPVFFMMQGQILTNDLGYKSLLKSKQPISSLRASL